LVACGEKSISRPAGVERASFELRFATPSRDGPALVEVSPKGERLVLDSEVLVSETDIAAVGTKVDEFEMCALQIFFTEQAGIRLHEATARRVGERVAFIVDDRVLVAAVVSSPVGNAVQVDTGYSCPEATRLAERLAP